MDPDLANRPGPSREAQGSPKTGPGESTFPTPAARSGATRSRKKARSESDQGSSGGDKRARIGPSSRSREDDNSEESSSTSPSYTTTPSSSCSSSRSGSPEPTPTSKPTPMPRALASTAEVRRCKRTPPRSPSPPISPIPSVRPRGAPALSSTAGNLESTRYMDLEATQLRTHTQSLSIPAAPATVPRTSYAAKAAVRPSTRSIPPRATVPTTSATPTPGTRGRAAELKRHPPILVEVLPNWPSHMAAIRERLGRAPSVRPHGSGFRFLPTSVEEYRAV
uniref:Uncharacterized protein n=1 Tax=Bombyx mori TaxID=7091 RepID=A0A8R2RA75_BOMMO|nr:putative uncharacterized protein DDB_G0290521 [Bombyx mori]